MFKRMLVLLLALAVALPLVPATAQEDLAGEITFVTFMGEWVTPFETAAADYMALHPGVTITVSTVPYDGLQDFYRTNLVGGTAPEIMHAEPWWNNFASLELIKQMDDVFAAPNPYNEDDTPWGDAFVQPFLDFTRDPGGHINVVPWSLYGVGMFYNKTFFDNNGITAPTNWDEFMTTCKAIKDAGALPMYVALKPNDAQWFWPLGMLGNFAMRSEVEAVNLRTAEGWAFDVEDPTSTLGESITVDEAWVAFNKGIIDPLAAPEYRVIAEMMNEWAENCIDRQAALAADGSEVYQAFWTGQSKIFMNGTWFISTLVNEINNLPEEQQFEWNIFAYPSPTADNGEMFSMGVMNQNMNLRNGFIVPANLDPAKEAIAIDFLQFMTSTEEASKLFSLNRVDEETGAEYPWSYDPPAVVGVPMRPGTEALYPRIDNAEMGLFLTNGQGDTQGWDEFLNFFGQQYLGGMIDTDAVLEEWSFSLEGGLQRALETYEEDIDQQFLDENLP
ncbi:MAG: extracellular solute-binding protein [Anaerolineae bacterium]|nr:extracellular solute-binding protein [Anaerolineae bacterium]